MQLKKTFIMQNIITKRQKKNMQHTIQCTTCHVQCTSKISFRILVVFLIRQNFILFIYSSLPLKYAPI